MEVGPVVALAVMALLLVAGQVLIPDRAKRIQRRLAAEPRALVEEAHGTVRVIGRVRGIGEVLHAPLSGRPCVAYELLLNGEHTVLLETREACPFLVGDVSGEARVDTSGPFRLRPSTIARARHSGLAGTLETITSSLGSFIGKGTSRRVGSAAGRSFITRRA